MLTSPFRFGVLPLWALIFASAAQADSRVVVDSGSSPNFSLVVQVSQGGYVQKILLDRAGRILAAVSNTGTVEIWDTVRRQQLWSFASLLLPGNPGAVALSPDGAQLAVGGLAGTVHLVDLATGRVSDTVSGNIPVVLSLAFSSNSRLLAIGGASGTVDVIDFSEPDKRRRLMGWALPTPQDLNGLTVVDRLQRLRQVSTMMFDSTSSYLYLGLTNGEIYRLSSSVSSDSPALVRLNGIPVGLAASGTDLLAAIMSTESSEVSIWNVQHNSIIASNQDCHSQIDVPNVAISSTTAIAACFSPVTGRSSLNMWSLPSGAPVTLPIGKRLEVPRGASAVTEDGTLIAFSADDRELRLWSPLSSSPAMNLEQSSVGVVHKVNYIPQTDELAISAGDDFGVWSLTKTTRVNSYALKNGQAAMTEDGKWLAYFDYRNKLIIHNRATDETIDTHIEDDLTYAIAISQLGPTVFWISGGGFGGFAKYWRSGDDKAHIVCSTDVHGQLGVSPHGRYALVGCNHGVIGTTTAEAILYRVADSKILSIDYSHSLSSGATAPAAEIAGLFFSPDEHTYGLNFQQRIDVKPIDRGAARVIPADLEHFRFFLGPIAMSRDQQLIAAEELEIGLPGEHPLPGKSLAPRLTLLDGYTGSVLQSSSLDVVASSLSFLPHHIAVGLVDGTVSIWSVPSMSKRATLVQPAGGWVAISPDGAFDGTPSALRWVGWRARGEREVVPLDLLYDRYYQPDLLQDVLTANYVPPKTSLANELGIGSLDFMFKQGYVSIDPHDSRYLCFSDRPTSVVPLYSDGAPLSFSSDQIRRGTSPLCPWRAQLPRGAAKIESGLATNESHSHCPEAQRMQLSKVGNKGALHVLTVAVGAYQQTSGFPALPSSVPSAITLEKLFLDQKRGDHLPFSEIIIHPGLRDGSVPPTIGNIKKAFRDLVKVVQSKDTVVLFLSGHGLVPPGSQMFYYAPVDFESSSISGMRDTGLSVAMLADEVRQLHARNILLIIDTCQSGAALTSLAKISKVRLRAAQSAPNSERPGTYIIASATALQRATGMPQDEASPLVKMLVTSVSKLKPTSLVVSASDLASDICRELPNISAQTPLIYSSGSDFPVLTAGHL